MDKEPAEDEPEEAPQELPQVGTRNRSGSRSRGRRLPLEVIPIHPVVRFQMAELLLEKTPVDFVGQPVQGVPSVEHVLKSGAEQVGLRLRVRGRFRLHLSPDFRGFTSIPGNYYTSQTI